MDHQLTQIIRTRSQISHKCFAFEASLSHSICRINGDFWLLVQKLYHWATNFSWQLPGCAGGTKKSLFWKFQFLPISAAFFFLYSICVFQCRFYIHSFFLAYGHIVHFTWKAVRPARVFSPSLAWGPLMYSLPFTLLYIPSTKRLILWIKILPPSAEVSPSQEYTSWWSAFLTFSISKRLP